VDDLAAAIEELAGLTVEERMRRFGLGADRADVIVPAALVYHRLASRAGVDRILAPGVGVREGIILELLAGGEALCDHPDRALEEACLRLGNRHGHDEAHARQVARLADRLFLDLAPLHGLGDDARRLLAAAALLHDIGVSVGEEDHHKHSLSLISTSELPGLSIEQVQVVANVARYHRKGLPTTDHEAFARLDDGRRAVVSRLAALLRIADALDRRHGSLVRSLHATARAREVELAVEAAADLAEERWALGRKADLFTELYGRLVVVTGGGSDP
jgi:exopolyphosphatase/guanosine-5'-triphosphate,3'-diphosphate pyrophosphatase